MNGEIRSGNTYGKSFLRGNYWQLFTSQTWRPFHIPIGICTNLIFHIFYLMPTFITLIYMIGIALHDFYSHTQHFSLNISFKLTNLQLPRTDTSATTEDRQPRTTNFKFKLNYLRRAELNLSTERRERARCVQTYITKCLLHTYVHTHHIYLLQEYAK